MIMHLSSLALAFCTFTLASSQGQNQLSINGENLVYTDKVTLKLDIPFTLYFNRTTASTTAIPFAVSAKADNQWVAIGFSSNGKMVPARTVIASKPTDGDAVVLEYNIRGKSSSAVQQVQDSVINNTSVEYKSDGTVAFAFTLPVQAEAAVKTAGNSGFIYAYGPQPSSSDRLGKHRKYGVAAFALDGSFKDASTSGDNRNLVLYAHVICMVLAWLVLAPIGALIGNITLRKRLFPNTKGNPKHIGPHRWTMVLVALLCTLGFILGIAFLGSHSNIAHMALGIVVFILLLAQATLGYWRTLIFPTGKPSTAFEKLGKSNKNTISLVHGWLGRMTWILAVVNVYLGLQINSLWDNPTVGIVLWAILSIVGALLFVAGPAYTIFRQ